MDYELLNDLIKAYTDHQKLLTLGTKTTLIQFAIWLNEQQYLRGEPTHSGHEEIIGRNEINTELGKLIVFLNRYARILIKKGLADFPELINDDFTYIYILMTAESMTKMQLIEKNVHEKASGLEVIKRLRKHGLIEEKEDGTDKRSKRVFLTEKGRETFFTTLDQMGKVSKLIAGNLTEVEKQQLFTLLKKLEEFHNPIYLHERRTALDQVIGKHL